EDAKKQRLREAAALAESALGDARTATECYEKILEADPSDPHALDRLVELEAAEGRFPRVAELLLRRIDVETDPEARVRLRKQLARTQAEHLGDVEAAIVAW